MPAGLRYAGAAPKFLAIICQSWRCKEVAGRCKTMRRTDDSSQAPSLYQVFAQGADLSGSECGPGSSQTQVLVEDVGGGAQQPAQLVGPEHDSCMCVDAEVITDATLRMYDIVIRFG